MTGDHRVEESTGLAAERATTTRDGRMTTAERENEIDGMIGIETGTEIVRGTAAGGLVGTTLLDATAAVEVTGVGTTIAVDVLPLPETSPRTACLYHTPLHLE